MPNAWLPPLTPVSPTGSGCVCVPSDLTGPDKCVACETFLFWFAFKSVCVANCSRPFQYQAVATMQLGEPAVQALCV